MYSRKAFYELAVSMQPRHGLRMDAQAIRRAMDNLMEAFAIYSSVRGEEGVIVDFRVEYANEAACRMTNRARDEYEGKRVLELYPGLEESEFFPIFVAAAERREATSRLNVPFDRTPHGVAATHYYDFRVAPFEGGFTSSWYDVTHRVMAERALQESEHRYRTLFDSMDEGFCVMEAILDDNGRGVDHRFLETNAAFERHTGLVNARGRRAREMVPDLEPRWPEAYGRVAVSRVPARFIDKSEAMGRWFEVDAFPIGEPEQRQVGLLFKDITERKQLEEMRRDEDRRKDHFLAMLAHELRNPLAPLRSSIDLLHMSGDDPEQRKHLLELMDRQSSHLVRLVDDLLDVSRITQGKIQVALRTLDLREVLRRAVEDAETHRPTTRHLSLAVPDDPVYVHGDEVRLMQVFDNLLSNAQKYTEAEGRIAVAVTVQDGKARVSVQDDGIGISAQQLVSIFDLYQQAERDTDGGLGIGLTLVRDLVALHGGSVEAASQGLGSGSEFSVTLPLSEAPPASVRQPAPGTGSTGTLNRVLVVDDNRDAADTLALFLGAMGASVETANDGAAALRSVETFRPHVVLLDIGMPGMNGYEVATAIREQERSASPVLVAVTGWGSDTDKVRAREAGFDEHLTKPVDADTLYRLFDGLQLDISTPN